MSSSKTFYGTATFSIFLLLFLYFFHPITNLVGDLGYYLKIGEIIYQTKNIPSTNLFSYTYPNFPFINPNWLSEVVLYLCYSIFDFNGLIFLSVLLIITAFAAIFRFAVKKFDVFTTILMALIAIHILYERTEVKPELFSFLFLAIFIVILYTYRERYTKWIFALLPLELLWVNSHIYFFVGIVVLFLFLADEFLSKKYTRTSKKFITLFAVTLGSCLITILNPNFLKGATYPFFVLNNYAFPVEENTNFFSAIHYGTYDPTLLFFGIAVIILWTSILFSMKKMAPIDIFLSFFFTCMGFWAVRTFPLFALATFIPGVKATSFIMHLLYNKIQKKNFLLFQVITFIAVCLLLIPVIKLDLTIHGVGFGVNDDTKQAIDFLDTHNIKGPIYNNYDIGNYLDFRLYPQEHVFVDGRPEAYPKAFFQDVYFPMQRSLTIFNRVANDYHFNTIIIKHTDTSQETILLLHQLVRSKEWKLVYLNNSVVIFVKNIPANQTLINENLIEENNVKLTDNDLNDKNKVRQLVNLFRAVEWDKLWLKMNLRYLYFEPTNCAALQNVAFIYQKEKRPDAQIYINKFIQQCSQQ